MPVAEPLVGWRLWRLRGLDLASWVAEYAWTPGENRARCLRQPAGCARPPGHGCSCGFWVVNHLRRCLELASAAAVPRGLLRGSSGALGLVAGWGEIAIHGREGFRAERAAVLAILAEDPAPFWPSLRRMREADLRRVAERYGVPLIRIETALRHGVLRELGLSKEGVAEVAGLLGRAA